MANEPLTQWHPAFCSAIKLELLENKNDLTYTEELGLNSKPIRIDLLVITKSPDVIINNDIGKIFRGHNIFEYKSPDDELNIDVFYKGVAYASLYKANGPNVDAIKADDITITFVRHEKPIELFRQLADDGYEITTAYNGIYHTRIAGLKYEIQIVVSSELDEEEHIWLTSLTKKLSKQNAETLVIKFSGLSSKDDKKWADSVLQVAIQENAKVFDMLKEDKIMCQALKELMRPEIEAEKEAAVKTAVEAAIKEKDAEKENIIKENENMMNEKDARIAELERQLEYALKTGDKS